jgi:hypothetical protein
MGNHAQSEPEPQRGDEVLLVDFDAGEHGHRGQYNAMLARLFRLRLERFSLAMLVSPAPVLCPQIETAPLRFALTCLVRGLLGRRTVGLLLRPLPALRGQNPRLRLKRAMLKLLRRTPGARVLTIVPFAVEPEFATIAHGWIHDLQNWDMALHTQQAASPAGQALAQDIRGRAAGRPVCCAIGRQDHDKGFDRFAALYAADPRLRQALLFAYGGKVSPPLAETARDFADHGGFGLDRFVSDAELVDLYAAADLVWCAYAPDYDQASGILGRAMQLGIPVVARRGSVIAAICANENHPCIELGDQDGGDALAAIPPRLDPHLAMSRAWQHGELSLARLAEALRAAPAWNPFAGGVMRRQVTR